MNWRPENYQTILLQKVKEIPDPKLLKGNLEGALLLFTDAGADAMYNAFLGEFEGCLFEEDRLTKLNGMLAERVKNRIDQPKSN